MAAPAMIEERFTFETQVGRGAFGEVYRGLDRMTGRPVAIKRLLVGQGDPTAADRFDREARLIAQVQSPYVVRYVAHGQDATSQPCLVLEWLEGEDLKRRQRRKPLTTWEAIEVARQAALGLEALHANGIVHRDVKPSNFFLLRTADDALEVKLLDLGTACGGGESSLTIEGWAIGTPAYMSPEQARGERNITPRSDLFSLGVVLFELLAGKRPFVAADNYALLAKIVLEDAPRLYGRVPGVTDELDRIVARAMAKRPDARFRSAREMAEALGAIRPGDVAVATAPTEELPTEMLRATAVQGGAAPRGLPRVSTLEEQRVVTALFAALDQTADLAAATDAVVAAVTTRGGATHETLGSRVIGVFGNARSSGDEVVRAASAALEVIERVPGARVAIATGRVQADAEGVSGEVLERAAALSGDAGVVRVDVPSARLLEARFVIEGPPGAKVLVAERDALDVPEKVLGVRTTCVGRDRELAVLEGIWNECVSERVARVALVTAPPGTGKSRLVHELVMRIVSSSYATPPAPPAGAAPGSLVASPPSSSAHPGPEILHARGESVGAGAPFGLIAPLLRRAARIAEGDPPAVRQKKLRARIARSVRSPDVDRIVALLGELCGVPATDADRLALAPLRSDPLVLGDAMRAAFCDWLAAETTLRPVIVVLDDLHWGDLPSVRFVDAALRQLGDHPLMVLALARPEVHAHFPALWSERAVHEIRLGPLTRRASEKLVREVLGEGVSGAVVATILERADGNAFYLEELIRAVAAGAGEALPDTVLGMVQARLDALGPEGKRVLRAASVFGSTFTLGGVVALLGGEARAPATARVLEDLCAREVLVEQRTSELPGERRYAFRNALVREAAYAILTEADRELGHRLAGDWLERAGGVDAVALAEHFRRGGQPERALGWFRRAAEQALEGNDFAAAIERGARGLALGATGESRGSLLLAQAEAHVWRGELEQAERVATEAAASLPQGTAAWFRAVSQVVVAAGRRGLYDRVAAWLVQATDAGGPGSASARVACLGHGAMHLCDAGMLRAAFTVMAKAEALARETSVVRSSGVPSEHGPATDRLAPGALAQVHLMRARRDLLRGDPFACLVGRQLAVAAFEQAQDKRQAVGARAGIGQVLVEIGEARAAEEVLSRAFTDAEAMGLHDTAAHALVYLAGAHLRLGAYDDARRDAARAIETGRGQQNRRLEGLARVVLAQALLAVGDVHRAEDEARAAIALLDIAPPARALACAALARVRLARNDPHDAVAWARTGHSVLDALGGSLEEGEIAVRLALVESLEASGSHPLARGALVATCARIHARADGAPDPMRRQAFSTMVAENARALALQAAWGE